MSWRDEISTALEEWIRVLGGGQGGERWRRVGTARPTGEPGAYAVDIRGSDLSVDQAEGLRLAGPEERSVRSGFPIRDATVDGELLRIRVAEFANLPEPCVWRSSQEPTFLVRALRDGLAALADAGLANLLARGEVGGVLAVATPPPWPDEQQAAYQACLGSGLWLVWGPPGTGKTKVLRAAASDLIASGRRVLLVSSTNIAVDNALQGVVKDRRPQSGEIVRVGPPQLREIAENPQVCLPLMVKTRLAEVEEHRQAVALELRDMGRRQEILTDLERKLDGFDAAAYESAVALLAGLGATLTEMDSALTQRGQLAEDGLKAIGEAQIDLDARTTGVTEVADARWTWAEADGMETELAQVENAAAQAEGRALVAENNCAATEGAIVALHQPGGRVRWRDRGALRDAQRRLEVMRPESERLRAAAGQARSTASAFGQSTESAVARLAAQAPFSRAEIDRRDTAMEQATTRLRDLEQAQFATLERFAELRTVRDKADAAQTLVNRCIVRGWPSMRAKATSLRGEVARDNAQRRILEVRHTELEQQYERLAQDAQGEIIRSARLVATTLARFRTVKAVTDGPYDVVLIDEVGSATLPEVLLAVAKASRCAVMLGDFMQLGPILPTELRKTDRADIQRWLNTDVFRHCGISTAAEAEEDAACLVLDTQHRFGPHVMQLANLLAYDGLLKAGTVVRSHADGDPEIVLLDTDGMNDLARVHCVSRSAGWWPAGLLLARALVELHLDRDEITGVITPYGAQAEATLEALRDMEPGGRPLAEVGTAHRFQGREFPVVVFDTVESAYERPLWIGQASRLPGTNSWQQEGVRLFNVATTRVQHRLYVIASRERIVTAEPGTAFGQLGELIRNGKVHRVRASSMVTPPDFGPVDLGPEGRQLAEVLARHVEITDIKDEHSFYDQFEQLISQAHYSIWLWSAWVASRVRTLLPLLRDAVDRGVQVTVFVRDPSDKLQGSQRLAQTLAELRAVVPTVIEVNVAHEKVVVIDEHTVMLGSLNVLSQRRSREVMVTVRGRHWARKLLSHLHAEEFSRPPRCAVCNGQQIDLRRVGNDDSWLWHCYSKICPEHGKGRHRGWTCKVVLRMRR